MKISRIARIAAVAAATTALGLAATVAPAAADVPAATPIQYLTQNFWGGSSTVPATGTVACPSGTRLVSSGASAPGGRLNGLSPDINSFTAATASAFAPGYFQVTVGCASTAAISEVTTRTIQLPYGSGVRRGLVSCPAGTHAFGGGGYLVKPFGIISRDASDMVSNAVSADGTGWTVTASTTSPHDGLIITTQCAPLRNSYVSQTGTPALDHHRVNVYGSCLPGYTALSGGAYLSRADGTEVHAGFIDYSVAASGNRWYVDGISYENPRTDKLVALEQCIR